MMYKIVLAVLAASNIYATAEAADSTIQTVIPTLGIPAGLDASIIDDFQSDTPGSAPRKIDFGYGTITFYGGEVYSGGSTLGRDDNNNFLLLGQGDSFVIDALPETLQSITFSTTLATFAKLSIGVDNYAGTPQFGYGFGNASYARYSAQVTLTQDSTSSLKELRFYTIGDLVIDNIAAVPIALEPTSGSVPESTTWAMLSLGMGAIGYTMRRRGKGLTRIFYAT